MYSDIYVDFTSCIEEKSNSREAGTRSQEPGCGMKDEGLKTKDLRRGYM